MAKPALLVLADGAVFRGESFGAAARAHGEVVFNTSMAGYHEILTDPSYAGQIVALTYPLAGNYGISPLDVESRRVQVRGFVVREACATPSHPHSETSLHDYLVAQGVPGIAGIDTRALTRRLRVHGVVMGTITTDETADEALRRLRAAPRYGDQQFVDEVTTRHPYLWNDGELPFDGGADGDAPHIVVLDLGLKYNIMRILRSMGCRVTAVPASTSAAEVDALRPRGVVLSPGPGDPALLDGVVATALGLVGKTPVMGICLGHQVLGRAFGADTYKLKFGHRGGNHPVRDLATGLVYITSQNHGYTVDPDRLSGGAEVSHINLNDGTVEGLTHRSLPIVSIQYHAEASPGPEDNRYLFERFLAMVRADDARAGAARGATIADARPEGAGKGRSR